MATTYYQGETINFQIQGDAVINFDANDFTILLYNNGEPIIIKKSECQYISANLYSATIANTVTKLMQTGQWIEEILYGTSETSIMKENCFVISTSQSKNIV